MQRTLFGPALSACAVLAASLLLMAVPSNARTITVTAGTPAKVHNVGSLSSATASAGQTFQIVAAEPLSVQGVIVVDQGASGQGHVVAVTPAGKKGKKASIAVQLDWILAVDGQQIPLAASTSPGTPLVFGPVGVFEHNYVKGKDVVVNSDFTFTAFVSSDRTINALNGY